MNEQKLTELARQGDLDAYGVLLEKHLPYLTNVCGRYFSDKHRVKDLVQEMSLLGIRYIPRKLKKGASFRAFMHRLATYVCKGNMRKLANLRETYNSSDFLIDNSKSCRGTEKEVECGDLFSHLLGTLDERTQEVVSLYAQGYTHKEIAASLGIGTQTSRDLLWKLRKRLKSRPEFQ